MANQLVPGQILNEYGNPYSSLQRRDTYRSLRAKFDAAQTVIANQLHWANADTFDPHTVAQLAVRQKLRSRSRYECIENNPYLKGTLITLCNDFVGTKSKGPRLKITERRLNPEQRRFIERRWMSYAKSIKLRRKLWRMRMAKIVDGEGIIRFYLSNKIGPIKSNWQVIETDMVSSQNFSPQFIRESRTLNEIDGVRFNSFDEVEQYHILHIHPGGTTILNFFPPETIGGTWIDEKFVINWFRQDRGWLRGIPETTTSLPLCALLRRYTLAVVRQKEIGADFAGVLETDGPPGGAWTDGSGGLIADDPFDMFPLESGLITTLPWGHKMKQLEAVPDGQMYDEFVGSLLREIVRPLLATYNIASGSSKDSNMASGVLDINIYESGQLAERRDCEEEVLDRIGSAWWLEGIRLPGYFDDDFSSLRLLSEQFPSFRDSLPEHEWKWDKVIIEHTDPTKIMNALETAHTKGFLLDEDIQEERFNRSYEDWQEGIKEQQAFREEIGLPIDTSIQPEDPDNANSDNSFEDTQ